MVSAQEYVVWLKNVDKSDVHYVGGKNANLGEMIRAGFPVPEGFAITTRAYDDFLKENSLPEKIRHLIGTINFSDSDSLTQVASHIRSIIRRAHIPDPIAKDVFSFYAQMEKKYDAPFVAIRPSATFDDSKTAPFAWQQESYLNIRGEAVVLSTIREAWASLFTAQAIFYRHDTKIDQVKTGISLVVQKMVQSDASGVMFTVDPVTNNRQRIIIEAIYGLGEYIVQGTVTPDHYEVNKSDGKVVVRDVVSQAVKLVYHKGENHRVSVSDRNRDRQKISDEEIMQLATLGRKIEEHYYFPQDIEWAVEKGKVYIVQTRPVTTLGKRTTRQEKETVTTSKHEPGRPILIGEPACPGVGIGKVKKITRVKDLAKIERGDILVADMTSPDYVPVMRKVAAIITTAGGRTSHAAIVSREFGIPAIVGATGALSRLTEGQVVTVHGTRGEVFNGSIAIKQEATHEKTYDTATKVYVNISEPSRAPQVAALPADGVGLFSAEFMIAEIGTHPKKIIEDRREKAYIEKLAESMRTICAAFYPRPVIYRTTDFKTNEYKNLVGGKAYEPDERNPMLGYRGALRYIRDPRVFNIELQAIKMVREKHEFSNLQVMVPFVRTVSELRHVKKLMNEAGLRRSALFKVHMMVEVPSNVVLIDEFINEGIDGISIGSNDLTMLMLGLDRDNENVAVEFNERDASVLWVLEHVIKAAKKHRITSSICGQALSQSPDLVDKLVKWGVSSISVSPDAVHTTRATVYKAEKKIIHGHG